MNTAFRHVQLTALLLPAALLVAAPQAPAPEPDETYQGEAPERYAMVRALEGEVRIRKGDLEETLTRGTPVGEGDVVESRGRGVLQLGDGTRLAFGGATRFTVAALFTDLKGAKQVLLRLDSGRLRVQLGGQGNARFRVDTPSGTVSAFDRGSFSLEAERDNLVRLKVHSGRVVFANERGEARVAAGERLTVYSAQDGLDRVRSFNTYDGDEFDRWSDRAMAVQHGESWERVPVEIRPYADELDGHGRWIQSDEFGWVWQPTGVAEDWRPYYQGRWAPYAGGMTWISDEPWAYVAYHHGRWHWGAGLGWCWIPGIYYSPAWVAWNYTPGYCGWAPLGYHNTPCRWGYGAWGGGYAWNVVSINFINAGHVHTRVHVDGRLFGAFNGGGRDLRAPWLRTPLMVSRSEFHAPGQIQGAFHRDLNRQRMAAYERQAQAATGRTIIRRELQPGGPAGPGPGAGRTPFEERRTQPIERFTPRERGPEGRPADRGRELTPSERRADPAPRERGPEPRPRLEERRVDPAPRERGPEPRPRLEERRVDPAPRERGPEPRPRPEERRVDPAPRERSPEPRPRPEERRPDPVPRERRAEPQPERRIDVTPVPRERPGDARPRVEERRPEPQGHAAPKPEAPRERPREEKKGEAVREVKR